MSGEEKNLKRWLKRKVTAIIITFLISGAISLGD